MNLNRSGVVLASSIVGLIALLAASSCSKPEFVQTSAGGGGYTVAVGGETPKNGTLKENDEASVTVAAQWMGEKDRMLVFGITMNTHSVALNQYDLSKLAVLVDDTGKEYTPASWNSEPGDHHRSGTLIFPVPDSLANGQAKYVKVIVKGIAGVGERIFEWVL